MCDLPSLSCQVYLVSIDLPLFDAEFEIFSMKVVPFCVLLTDAGGGGVDIKMCVFYENFIENTCRFS